MVQIGQKLGRRRANFGKFQAKVCRVRANLAENGPDLADAKPKRPIWVETDSLGTFGPKSAELDRTLGERDRIWPELGDSRHAF